MGEVTKVCGKCKIEKEFEFFSKDKSRKDGMFVRCKSCTSKYFKKYYEKHADKVKVNNVMWRKENREIINNYEKKYSENLSSSYVAKTVGLSIKHCPQELIELKRIQILIGRELRSQKNEQRNKQNNQYDRIAP